jgi:hypothetical protein
MRYYVHTHIYIYVYIYIYMYIYIYIFTLLTWMGRSAWLVTSSRTTLRLALIGTMTPGGVSTAPGSTSGSEGSKTVGEGTGKKVPCSARDRS